MSKFNTQLKLDETLPAMPKVRKREFFELLQIQSNGTNEKRMVLYICKKLDGMGVPYTIDAIGNVIAVKGKAEVYPCIVSHLDTVHDFYDHYEAYVHKKGDHEFAVARNGKWSVGVGGDDQCGIYSCLYMLKLFENIKVVFFTKEEGGCVGSSKIDHDFFDDVGYIIQLDRWGRGDFICRYGTNFTVSKDFLSKSKNLREKFGYDITAGLYTDSINLWDAKIGVSCINVSCGYYQHHSTTEYVDLPEFWNSLLMTKSLIKTLGEERFASKPEMFKRKKKKLKPWNDDAETTNVTISSNGETKLIKGDTPMHDSDSEILAGLLDGNDEGIFNVYDYVIMQAACFEFNTHYKGLNLREITQAEFKTKAIYYNIAALTIEADEYLEELNAKKDETKV